MKKIFSYNLDELINISKKEFNKNNQTGYGIINPDNILNDTNQIEIMYNNLKNIYKKKEISIYLYLINQIEDEQNFEINDEYLSFFSQAIVNYLQKYETNSNNYILILIAKNNNKYSIKTGEGIKNKFMFSNKIINNIEFNVMNLIKSKNYFENLNEIIYKIDYYSKEIENVEEEKEEKNEEEEEEINNINDENEENKKEDKRKDEKIIYEIKKKDYIWLYILIIVLFIIIFIFAYLFFRIRKRIKIYNNIGNNYISLTSKSFN